MKSLLAAVAILTAALSFRVGMSMSAAVPPSWSAGVVGSSVTEPVRVAASSHPVIRTSRTARRVSAARNPEASLDVLNDVMDAYCIDCHSNDLKLGNLTLEG